jgi:hypothetical protein
VIGAIEIDPLSLMNNADLWMVDGSDVDWLDAVWTEIH